MATHVDIQANGNSHLILYAVRDCEGEWYAGKGCWAEELKDAKVWAKSGPARTLITTCANGNPADPVPSLVELHVTHLNVVDEKKRVEKSRRDKKTRDARRYEHNAKRDLERAKEDYEKAKARLHGLEEEQ